MPVYNAEPFLQQAIESVLSQTFKDFELILIDDGSTDSSSLVCDIYARKTSKVRVRHTRNRGLSAARNLALSFARGKYVAFVDADDIIHPLFAEFLLDRMEKEGAEMAITPLNRFSDSISLYKSGKFRRVEKSNMKKLWVWMQGMDAAQKCLYRKSYMEPSACGKLFSRSLFEEKSFREGTYYEDLDLIPLLMLKSERVLLNELTPLYHYRQHERSFIHTFEERRLDVLDVTARLSSEMKKYGKNLEKAAYDRELSASFNIFSLIVANRSVASSMKWKEAEERCWNNIKKYRSKSIFNTHSRIRNKICSLVSCIGGKPLLTAILSLSAKAQFLRLQRH